MGGTWEEKRMQKGDRIRYGGIQKRSPESRDLCPGAPIWGSVSLIVRGTAESRNATPQSHSLVT